MSEPEETMKATAWTQSSPVKDSYQFSEDTSGMHRRVTMLPTDSNLFPLLSYYDYMVLFL